MSLCDYKELRGVWITTVYGIDWPKTTNDPKAHQKEFIETAIYIENNLKNIKLYGVGTNLSCYC